MLTFLIFSDNAVRKTAACNIINPYPANVENKVSS